MKTLLTLLLLLGVSISSYSQDMFGNPRRYDVNVTYSPSLPTMYASMLMEKKRQYDQGVISVREKISSVQRLVSNLFEVGSTPYDYLTMKINEDIKKLNESNFDYSNPNVVYNIVDEFSRWETLAYRISKEQKEKD